MNNRRKELMLASAKEYCKCVVEGKTLKYNQLANIVNKQAEVIQGLTISTTNGLIKINGTSTTDNTYFDYQIAEYSYTGFKANHKYFIWLQQSNYGRVFLVASSPYNEINDSPIIFTCTSSQYLILRVATNGITYNNYCVRVNIIDLTALGLDSITSTSDFFATDLGKYVKNGNYLPFSSGDFIHSKTPIHFKGVNIWNEQWEVGYLNLSNGQNAYGTDEIRSADYIKVIPNTTYYHTFVGRICYYDKDKNYIGNSDYVLAGKIRTPMNCEFIRFYTSDYGNTYLNDICISQNVWDENWEVGLYLLNAINNVGKIKVLPSQTFYVSCPTDINIYEFDKNNVNTVSHNLSGDNKTFKTREDTRTIAFYVSTSYGTTYNNNIGIFYYGYHKYCGTKTYYEPLTYNQLVQNGNFASTDNWSLNGCTLSVLDNVGILTITANANSNGIETGIQLGGSSHKYALVFNAYSSRTTKMNFSLGGSSIAGTEEYITTTKNQFKFIFTNSGDSTTTLRMFVNLNNLFLQNGDKVYLSNFMVIDLTNLYGAGNEPTSVDELNETDLGKAIDNGEYLPYSVSNDTYYLGGWDMYKGCVWKSWNGQLTKTMSLINLDNLSWTSEDIGMVAQLPSNFKTFEDNELASVIAEKYETAKYNDEILDSICIADIYGYGYSVVIRYGDTQPSGFALFELATPTTENVTTRMVSRRTINVESENEIDLDFTKE